MLTRKSLDWGLALFLLIFTAGVGLIIYIIHYYTQPENLCIHCGSIIENENINELKKSSAKNKEIGPILSTQNNPYRFQANKKGKKAEEIPKQIRGMSLSYCSYCGERTDQNSDLCQNCGSEL